MRTDYCNHFTKYDRLKTPEVRIGGKPIGNSHPVRIQSMTNTDTNNIHATVDQVIKIFREGADFVRITVPNRKAAENLTKIKAELKNLKISVPLIADIHFNPELALLAASVVDKVRINPGNYIDHGRKNEASFNDKKYMDELEKQESKFIELLEVCKKHNTALRIGTNHGSLSNRILSKYGDTLAGMAESAMEFLRICKHQNFDQVVVSIKASNTRIMVYATRMLVSKMKEENILYPVHLGVTEAGEGEDGRIKSAVGIGALLSDGIGDTIRVSLTEDPELEIPVARKIVDYYVNRSDHEAIEEFGTYPVDPFHYEKRISAEAAKIGGKNLPCVVYTLKGDVDIRELDAIGWHYSNEKGWSFADLAPDCVYTDNWPDSVPVPEEKTIILPYNKTHAILTGKCNYLMTVHQYRESDLPRNTVRFVLAQASEVTRNFIDQIREDRDLILILESENKNSYADIRSAMFRLILKSCVIPVVFHRKYNETDEEDLQLKSSLDLGGLFIDGMGDGIWIENEGSIPGSSIVSASFGILQASRVRMTRTEYISCPSCGRTLFDLQATTQKIREKTSHLRGLKIGIMGCIVNGPGEMADADYGYVGGAKGRITLYKEKEIIKRNVPEETAVDELISLIKENGDWIDP
jgi:(E)-4-hydroxy-3-methylbut-2-enyl-diphosphate synthase